jgi:digeranylgeranylglycerophospholipid reductase
LPDFDVVVVGGGCAGLWASKAAAENAASTLLVERAARIGDRTLCAEGVGAQGMSGLIDLKPEWIATSIDRAKVFSPDGSAVEFEEPGCGFILNKDTFLHGLSELAAGQGVEIWLGCEVKKVDIAESDGLGLQIEGTGGRRSIGAGSIVAADGIESAIARQCGLQKGLGAMDVFSCAQYTVSSIDVDPHALEFHFGREVAPGGYGWVFPKGDGMANVGVGTIREDTDGMSAKDYLERFKEQRCPQSQIIRQVVGGVPSLKSPYPACGSGVFLAGDAARIADPITGAGIVPGMMSGAIAGAAAQLYSTGDVETKTVEKRFVRGLKNLHGDRNLRFAVRRAVTGFDDKKLAKMIQVTGKYGPQDSLIKGDPLRVAGFLLKAMPEAFGMIKHLVRS